MSASAEQSAGHPAAAPREVPAFDEVIFRPQRSTRFCVGVPVLNEGERIRGQLERMAGAGLGCDIVIADGGSTDGAVDPDFLAANGVRALLTKTGPGRMGAQLRMLFAWALDQGYEGVITIDGNGKDGLEGIVRIREKLEEGYDFVQGSRYLPGGYHENTPLDRQVGVRMVHSPLVSLAAGFRYTDSLNGLRGWSARLLEDPRVAPLRDCFDRYEIHYYLSIRAPRLGYRVCEVPADRRYPATGPTPSKINGVQARLDVLRQLLMAVSGRLNPDPPA